MERVFRDLEDRAYEELKTLCKKSDISPSEWECVEKIVCIIHKIYEMDEQLPMGDEGLYSNRRMPRHYSNGYRDGMYITPAVDHRGYSDDYMNRYSRHSIKDRAIDRLERMMDESKSESERESIRKMIGVLEHTELY